jgi:hypothetical protein
MVLVEHIQHQRLQGICADQPMVSTQQPALIVAPGLDLHTHAGHIVHTWTSRNTNLGPEQQPSTALLLTDFAAG